MSRQKSNGNSLKGGKSASRISSSQASSTYRIRKAIPSDAEEISTMIDELAVFEKLGSDCQSKTPSFKRRLKASLRRKSPSFFGWVAELQPSGRLVGYALCFQNFSTFLGRPGLYLEDLYVRPECRGLGVGEKLFSTLMKEARRKRYGRVEFSVLDWNKKAHRFYRKWGAKPQSTWTVWRISLSRKTQA